MAKFYGVIGYAETVETKPGVWEEQIIERSYRGDMNRHSRRLEPGEAINDDINVYNEFSIVADPYAIGHIHAMRYIKYQGAAWKISNVSVQYPRLLLTSGGLYTNG